LHLKYFGLEDGSGKAITFSEWATLAQDRAGRLELVARAPFDIGKPRPVEQHQRRSGGPWRCVPKKLNNGVHSSVQKQTQKRLKSGYQMGVKCPNSKVFLEEIRPQEANALPATPEEKRKSLALRAQETEQRRALFSAKTDAETT
jgi:hypothetical protein